MQYFQIIGGRPLSGETTASGSKNAALPIMAASILAEGPVRLERVPRLTDVETLSLVLGELGVEVRRDEDDSSLWIETVDHNPVHADYELVRRMRASFCVLGPLLARRGRAVVSLPGGCNIGTRPVDLHLAGLEALGASIRLQAGYVYAEASRLVGATVHMSGPFGPSVTGTANLLSAAVLAKGQTVITGAAREPEIIDLGEFLIAMGAEINGLGTAMIEIRGVDGLSAIGYQVIPDRIETATLLTAAAITGGQATVRDVKPAHLTAVLQVLSDMGADVHAVGDAVTIKLQRRPRPVHLTAQPYPGVPTDLQSQLMALAALADGESVVTDAVFPDRFLHAAELNRLGARIQRRGSTATINGVDRLTGTTVMASDLRASAALLLAGLVARGETIVNRIYHLDRGYERLDEKLAGLGAQIRRRETDQRESTLPSRVASQPDDVRSA
jgi:UDP-N-acetylglucosamine 1-carboxyvinyltransferase